MIFTSLLALALGASAPAAQPQGPDPDPRLTPAPGIRVDADFLTGRWSDQQDCSVQIDFRADGNFVNQDGSHGTWRMHGDALTLSGNGTITVRIVPRSRDEINVVNPDGSIGYSRRCSGDPNPQV